MAHRFDSQRLIENCTPTQKEALLSLEAQRLNVIATMAEKEREYKSDRKDDQKDLDSIEARLLELVEAIESGQSGLPFDEGGEGDELVETCPDCEGSGKDPSDRRRNCQTCDGNGTIPRSPRHSMPVASQ